MARRCQHCKLEGLSTSSIKSGTILTEKVDVLLTLADLGDELLEIILAGHIGCGNASLGQRGGRGR